MASSAGIKHKNIVTLHQINKISNLKRLIPRYIKSLRITGSRPIKKEEEKSERPSPKINSLR